MTTAVLEAILAKYPGIVFELIVKAMGTEYAMLFEITINSAGHLVQLAICDNCIAAVAQRYIIRALFRSFLKIPDKIHC